MLKRWASSIVGILVVIVVTAVFLYVFISLYMKYERDYRKSLQPFSYTPYVAFYPYSYRGMVPLDKAEFEQDINISKQMGFNGVKLWNVECYYDDGSLSWAMDKLASYGLKVIIPFNFFDRTYHFPFPSQAWSLSGFPYNTTQVDAYATYVSNVAKLLISKENLQYYLIYYPFNGSDYGHWCAVIGDPVYQRSLQEIINAIWDIDKLHPIYLGAMLWMGTDIEQYNLFPKNFTHIEGFGFQAYSLAQDDIDTKMIDDLYNYWSSLGKKVFISEWGVHTTGTPTYGRASSESKKCSMIASFLDHIYFGLHDTNVTWVYFGLHDFPPERADFGLINDNHVWKDSGKTMSDYLNGIKR